MSSSVSWKKSKRLNSIKVSPDGMPYIILSVSTTWCTLGKGGDEPQSIHVLSGWLERLYTNQTEDNSIPMSGTVRMVVVFDLLTQLILQNLMAYLWPKKMENLDQDAVEVFALFLAQILSTGFLLWDWKISWSKK